GVLVNRVYPRRFDDRDARRVAEALEQAPDLLCATALRAALSQRARREAQEQQLARLCAGTHQHALELPLLAGASPDRAALEALGERLLKDER
ncbi:MAG TPA: hypothetical protein VED41_12510, partial [Solirubrobacteraceae bacterium]|nr:hypothetical protein [Solirubrobacteraceae bacterium]